MAKGWFKPVLVLAGALASGCQSASAPSSSDRYAGEWAGTTAQGRPIAFTIGPDEMVTRITVGHEFSSCSGSQTFSNLNLSIAPDVSCIPGPCPPSITSFRQFDYQSGTTLQGPSTEVHGLFASTSRAEGSINFRNFDACGTVLGVSWTASRR